LAHQLATLGHDVNLWAYEKEVADGINRSRRNPLFLTDARLSERITATNDLHEAVCDAALVLFVIPAQLQRSYLGQAKPHLPAGVPLVICSKGIERESLATMEEVFEEELPEEYHGQISVLSGPSFAAEVARGMPTYLTVACRNPDVAKTAQEAMASKNFRIYTTDDVMGVSIGGALKNVMAIAVGASDALGLGDNTRAGLITRGLAEITRLALSKGGRSETMLGLAGAGDLILTCTGDLSRNRTVGKLLAKGLSRAEIDAKMNMVAEGIATTESAHFLAKRCGVDLPITEQIYGLLFGGTTVLDALQALQDRSLKEEWRA
jgi:glycerol-3-phosphate dehydrogenase (NAD(P)+)